MIRIKTLKGTAIAAALLSVILSGPASADSDKPSNKWRLEFSGGAHSDGIISLELRPVGGTPIVTTAEIKNDTGENAVAKAVVVSLQAQLPPDGYHIERDDGEDVLIKKKRGAADFGVRVISNTVEHVRINLDRE